MGEGGEGVRSRFLVKLSGEYLGGDAGTGFCNDRLDTVCQELQHAHAVSSGLAVVVGGGNFFRGGGELPSVIKRVTGDRIGMLATAMNALALRDALRTQGMVAKTFCAFPVGGILEHYDPHIAQEYLEQGVIVLLAGGTGNPFFTTDTTACLRALELNADMVIKATRVNGVFDRDPEVDPNAVRYDHINYDFAIAHQLKVMDSTAFTLCRDHALPVRVIDLGIKGNLAQAVSGESVGTLVDVSGGSS